MALLALLVLESALLSQPIFEVASIKPNASGAAQMVIRTPPSGLIRATNITPQFLIRFAYDVPDFRIVGAPAWTGTKHFDITARAPENTPLPVLRGMLRALLAERFGLIAHADTRDMPIDVLSAPGAIVLRPRAERCVVSPTAAAPACGLRVAFGRIAGVDASFEELAQALTTMTQRMVIDRTGLDGRYDFTLEYPPDAVALMPPPEARVEFPRIDPMGPSLKTALKEQLGLKLEAARGPVGVIVIDRVIEPTPD